MRRQALVGTAFALLLGCRKPPDDQVSRCTPPSEEQLAQFVRLQTDGLDLYQRHDSAAAIQKLSAALKLNPCDVSIYNDLAIAHHQAGQAQAALATLRKGVALDPLYPLTHLNLAIVYQENNELASAEKELKELIQLSPDLVEGYRRLGILCFKTDRFDEARSYLEKALSIAPDDQEVLFNVGNIYYHEQNFARAAELYQKTLSANPNNVDAHYKLALSLQRLGRDAEAKVHFDRFSALSVHQEQIDGLNRLLSSNPERADSVLFALGSQYAQIGRFQDAIDSFERSLLARPGQVEPLIGIAQAKLSLNKLDKALEVAQQAVKLAPDNLTAHICLMSVYAGRGELDEAKQVVQDMMKRFPSYPNGRLNLAILEQRAGHDEAAIRELSAYLRGNPDSPSAHDVLLAIYTRSKDPRLRDKGKALEQAREALRLGSRQFDYLAEAYHMNGDTARASELLRKGIAELPADQVPALESHLAENRARGAEAVSTC